MPIHTRHRNPGLINQGQGGSSIRCPRCSHIRTRIIRTRPDPDLDASDLIRQCKETSCLTVFTSREAVVSVIENSRDKHVLLDLAARIAKLPDLDREELVKIIQ